MAASEHTARRSAHPTAGASIALALSLASAILGASGCRGSANDYLSRGELGIRLVSVAGDFQTSIPNQVFKVPLKVNATDVDSGAPVKNLQVDFTELADTGSTIITPTSVTDDLGLASTNVRAGTVSDRPIRIEARVRDSSHAVVFELLAQGQIARYSVTTTHGGTEPAKGLFGFVVSVVDDDGNVFNDVQGTRSLTWAFESSSSWGGEAPLLPSSSPTCTFTNGVCRTAEIYYLTDSRAQAFVSVGDGADGYADAFHQPITVTPGSAAGLLISDRPSGPSAGAVVRGATLVMTAGGAVQTLQGAITDAAGNYLSDVPGTATWTSGAAVVTGRLSAGTGSSVTYTSRESGSGTLTLNHGGYPSATLTLAVNPGTVTHLSVTTENGGTEEPGIAFKVNLLAKDAHENTVSQRYNAATGLFDAGGGYTGSFSTTFNLDNAQSGPLTSNACPRVVSTSLGETYYTGQCYGRTKTQSFIDGVAAQDYYVILNDATSVSPAVRVTIGAQNGFPGVTGATPVISIAPGAADHIMLYSTAGTYTGFRCYMQALSAGDPCLYPVVGTPYTVHAGLEDRGGNFLGNVAADWTPSYAWTGQFAPVVASTSSTLTPATAGYGSLSVTFGGTTTQFLGITAP